MVCLLILHSLSDNKKENITEYEAFKREVKKQNEQNRQRDIQNIKNLYLWEKQNLFIEREQSIIIVK